MSSKPRLCVIFLDILPPQWIFPPFASSICLLCSSPPLRNRVSQNGCWERSGMRRAACSRTPSPSPSLSLSLAFTLPRTCLLPASSLHLPTLSFSLSSSPSLSYTHTHTDTHFSSLGFSQLLLCHCQPCQTERFTAHTPQRNK